LQRSGGISGVDSELSGGRKVSDRRGVSLATAAGRLLRLVGLKVIRSKTVNHNRPARRGGSFSAVVAMAYLVKFLHFFFTERLLVAEQVRHQRDFREVLHGFHFHVSTFERGPKCHHPVIRHQDGVMARNQGLESVGQFGRTWGSVACQRDRTQTDNNFAHQRPVQIVTRSGEPGGGRRVRVDDARHVGAQAIDQQVHSNLARNPAPTGKAFSLHVYDYHVGSAHPALAYTSRSHQQAPFIETDGEVPVGCRNKSAFVQQATVLHNLETMLAITRPGHCAHGTARLGSLTTISRSKYVNEGEGFRLTRRRWNLPQTL